MARDFARKLRKSMTDAERWLWYELRAKRFDARKFRRQAPVGDYIVDFVCFESKLILELDGGQHPAQADRDEKRTAWLNSQGFRVLRFWNHQVFEESEAVLETIWNALNLDAVIAREGKVTEIRADSKDLGKATDPSPQPSPTRGEGAGRKRI